MDLKLLLVIFVSLLNCIKSEIEDTLYVRFPGVAGRFPDNQKFERKNIGIVGNVTTCAWNCSVNKRKNGCHAFFVWK